jgi:CRP-like cAMP-binding protein
MDEMDISSEFASHSPRNVFRRHLQEPERKEFRNDANVAISALESIHSDRYRREYLLTKKEEDALENLFFPKQNSARIFETKWSHEANSEHYLHLLMPRTTVQMLFSHARIKRVKAGTILNAQSRSGSPLIVVLDGQCQGFFSSVGVESIIPDDLAPADYERTFGKEQCMLEPGDIFGCEMFCHHSSSSMTLIAKSSVVTLKIEEKVLSVLLQQWRRAESFKMSYCRHLLEIQSSDATRMITDVLQMQCTLGISGLFAKKRKISMKQDLIGCMLASIPGGVDVVKFLAESFRTSNHDFLPLKMQECRIQSEEHVGAFVVLSGSFVTLDKHSFESAFGQFARNTAGLSILGPPSMVELRDPFFKQKCSSDEEICIISREQSDVLLIPHEHVTRMAFRSWFCHSDSIDLEKCTAVSRKLIAVDSTGKHAKSSSSCTVGDVVAIFSSEARKSFLDTPEHDHVMNVLIHEDCSGILENVLKSQLSSLMFLDSYCIKVLASCVELVVRMPVAVHQSHAKKIFNTVITDADSQTCCIIIVRGSCVSQSTLSATHCGVQNSFAANVFNSMLNVPSDEKLKTLKSQDIFFIESLSSLQCLSQDFLALTLPINCIDSWADDCMSTWVFAKHALNVPYSSSLDYFYSKKDRLAPDDCFVKKDPIPDEIKQQRHKVKPLKPFATPTHSSKLKRSSKVNSEFFDDLRAKNDKSSRLRLRRKILESEKFEEIIKEMIDNKAGILEHWRVVDVNSSGAVSMSELQNWLTMQFPGRFHSSKVIFVSFRETLKHFRIISQGYIELQHFLYFLQILIDYVPAELVFDELDVNSDKKFSLSEFTVGMKKLGLVINEIELGSDFKDILESSGTDATFDCFCRWFHRRDLKRLLLVQNKKAVIGQSNHSDLIQFEKVASITDPVSFEDLEIEMCTVLQLHPQFKLIPDRIALDLPFEMLKIPKGATIMEGSSYLAPRHIMFIIEGVVTSLLPGSSCNPTCLCAGSSINQTVCSPWHRHRVGSKIYCGSTSIGDSNFFYGVGDGLEYIAMTDVVLMVLRWQVVEVQWQQTMLMDLQSQTDASEYFLWSKVSSSRTNHQQMKLLSSVLNRRCEATLDTAVLALLCCHSQLCKCETIAQNSAVNSPVCSGIIRLPSDSVPDTTSALADACDDGILQITFQIRTAETMVLDTENSDVAHNFLGGSAPEICQSAIAFIVTGPAFIVIKGSGMSILTDSKQADEGVSRRQTTIDIKRDSKKTKTWRILMGQCAVVTSEQLASICRGRMNFSKDKCILSMCCHADKRNIFQYPVLSANRLNEAIAGSVAAIDGEVRIALQDMCCTNFVHHVSSFYSNHTCFSTNSVSNLALSHSGTKTLKFFMGETIWKIGQEGIFLVLSGILRIMFSFGELKLIPDSRNSGMSVSNHVAEILCLGQMSIFGDIGCTVSGDIDGHIFIDCADTTCELLYFPPSAISCFSSQCQTDLKKLLQSRSQILKQFMLKQKNILHTSSGFQKEKMHTMHLAESESNRVQFMRDPNRYSQISDTKDVPNSIAEISASRHFTSSKTILMKNTCFQSLNENVKDCSAGMASFYKNAGRQSKMDDTLEMEARKFEEHIQNLNFLPLNSAPKLKRLLKNDLELKSNTKIVSDGPTPSEIMFDSIVAPIVPLKHVSDAQKRINEKILKLKSDDNLMEAFKNRVSQLLVSMPKKGELEKRNKDVSSYATPEAKARRLQANSDMMRQRCEQAKRNSILLESSFKESTAQKLEQDQIRIQNNLLLAENRLRQKNIADFQLETMPVFAMISRFHFLVKLFLSEVPKARHTTLCIVLIQRWVKRIQLREKIERRNRVHQTFRRAFRRFKMMYCLWIGTFALKLLIKFMRERKKARQVTFVIRSYM